MQLRRATRWAESVDAAHAIWQASHMGDALPSSFFSAVSISATSPAIESNAVVSGSAADTLATDASSELAG